MKKIIIAIICVICCTINVNAEGTFNYDKDSTTYNNLKAQYEKGIQKIDVNGSEIITLYGYSDCNGTSCNFKYSKTSGDYKEVLKKSINCTNGEKYIIYQLSGTVDGFKSDNKEKYTGDVYWSEEFYITCTNTQSSSTITLNNTVGTSSGGSSSGGTSGSTSSSSGSTSSSSGSTGSEYNSSTTTESKETGVETYYIVLGTVGIITYAVMRIVKKQNLFKNI